MIDRDHLQPAAAGLFAAVVGYCSSVAVVIHGMQAVGAGEAEIASGLAVLSVLMGLLAIGLSVATRMPVSVAWSTPGMALLATMTALPGGFASATGAFIATGALIVLAGLWSPLGRLVAAIPRPIANGMLAGILIKLCLAPFVALGKVGPTALLVIVVWLLVGRFRRLWAAPAALVVAIAAMALGTGGGFEGLELPRLVLVTPSFDWQAMVSIALPLFIVTMASQNIPGLTVLSTYGYHPPHRPVFLLTGLASALGAAFGAPTINLAAITAVLCAGPDAHPDPSRRWMAGAVNGVAYVGFAFAAAVATALVTRSSPVLIEAVAGLALIGAFASATLAAVKDEAERLPAVATFLVTASGLSLFGIGAAFWGLLGGLAVHALYRRPLGRKVQSPGRRQ